ncbi:YgaP family membrane protein [Fredinandcohnia sp. FSL W7-1320]|uniref:YgaP family membrane protein n=1 Tax=Fredinandcohnia sp. FSL W7-1320 TaxID=2954540 RepID=UPI0030FD7C4B
MKPNIGMINALVRITCGFTMLAWATAKMVKRPWRESFIFVAMLGGMKVAEGITRFCPLTALFQEYVKRKQEEPEPLKELPPINPS